MSDGAGCVPGAPGEGDRQTVVVIGGGFTGAVVAHQLARRAPARFRIVVVEPRSALGGGVAYSTADPAHRINVPASRMSFVPSDPCHFERWLKADGALVEDPEAVTPDGRAFPRRQVFGRYAAETMEPYLLAGAIEHRRDRAVSVDRSADGGCVVHLAGGEAVAASFVVLAATHPAPAAPAAFDAVLGDPRLIPDPRTAPRSTPSRLTRAF
ncbi:FAD-dependent oxidoreductase [Chenggangzhangella methanolivorans]|uniref:FAD-dependent oxidoreductase n=1 Tax=Chenggangzhangella methanolivorans TaxID=1437009 RepID=UPI0021BD525A|nr:FAD-dependent oxidoreductase [Chenggangzhangella methanolivorans]